MDWIALEEELIRDEGLRLRPYVCPAGHPTIGVGHRIRSGDVISGGISLEYAGTLLREDCATALSAARTVIGRECFDALDGRRQRALVNMAYNLGQGGLARFSKMIAAVREGRWEDAARECLDSAYARQVGARAQRIAAALRGGGS